MSPEQQVWTACWSGLVHAGWDSLVCAWHIHRWYKKTFPFRGWRYCANQLKCLAHTVRSAALQSEVPVDRCDIPKNVVNCLIGLAKKQPTDGFAFSRLARALPLPPASVVDEALAAAEKTSREKAPTSGAEEEVLYKFVCSKVSDLKRKKALRNPPKHLPSSQSSCYEWPATRGGVDGFLSALGAACEAGWSEHDLIRQIVPSRLKAADLKPWAQDSLGRYCYNTAQVILAPELGPVCEDIREAYRCAGLLALRRHHSETNGCPRMRLEGLRAPGMKARVVGVPDALTFVEGSWIRGSAYLMAPGHWYVESGPSGTPSGLRYCKRGGKWYSVDLTRATDLISHAAIRGIIRGLVAVGLIRKGDESMANRSLGLEPLIACESKGRKWPAKRGSPMGTPLSFPVLSWLNAFAMEAFDNSAHHGDDGVGNSPHAYAFEEYCTAIEMMGGEVNRKKTFISPACWTMCEVACGPTKCGKGRNVFVPPPCPPPGLKAPVAAEARCGNRYLRRQERVMKTLFPWIVKDPRLHLPVEVGGLGYLGRGLAVGAGVRSRLGALVSRGVDWLFARSLTSKRPFREEGIYPRPLTLDPAKPAAYWRAKRNVDREQLTCQEGGTFVTLEELVRFKAMLTESEYRLSVGDSYKRARATGRPARTKSRALFRRTDKVPICKPLGKWTGAASLRRFAERCKALPIRVPEDIADRKSVV